MKRNKSNLRNIVITYSMGVFNDNFFKQAALLLATTAGLISIQGKATLFFALPFVLFSAWAGWTADHFSKRNIVIVSKIVELAIMSTGIIALFNQNWTLIVTVVFFMSMQSTFFSPALNGSIPEYFSGDDVPRVNAVIKLVTTVSILFGIAFAGFILDLPLPSFAEKLFDSKEIYNRTTIGIFATIISVAGVIAALRIMSVPKKRGKKRAFPWLGPIDSLRHAKEYSVKDPELFLVICYEALFYVISSAAVLCINNLGVRQLGLSYTQTSLISVALMVGVGIGAIRAGKNEASSWQRTFVPAGIIIGTGLVMSAAVFILPKFLCLPYLLLLFIFTGIAGGMYLIPLMSFIQIKPSEREKGKVLGISNFFAFSGILITGAVFSLIPDKSTSKLLFPASLLVICGVLTILVMLIGSKSMKKIPNISIQGYINSILGTILGIIFGLRYRLKITGLDKIKPVTDRSILFLPNHPALIDPVIMCILLRGIKLRPLGDEGQMSSLFGRIGQFLSNAVLLPDPSKARRNVALIYEAMDRIANALKNGDNVLFYCTGKLARCNIETLGTNSGLHRILQSNPETRIVLVRYKGLWGSSFSYGYNGKAPDFTKAVIDNVKRVIANGLFFMPKRVIEMEFIEANDFPRTSCREDLNKWMDDYYLECSHEPLHIPYYFWLKNKG